MDRACRLFPGGGSEECLCGGGFQGNGTNAVKASPPVVSLGRRGHKSPLSRSCNSSHWLLLQNKSLKDFKVNGPKTKLMVSPRPPPLNFVPSSPLHASPPGRLASVGPQSPHTLSQQQMPLPWEEPHAARSRAACTTPWHPGPVSPPGAGWGGVFASSCRINTGVLGSSINAHHHHEAGSGPVHHCPGHCFTHGRHPINIC